jgi:hypothetical protein
MTASREFFAWLMVAALLVTNVTTYLGFTDARKAMQMETDRANRNYEELRENQRDYEARMLRVLKGM